MLKLVNRPIPLASAHKKASGAGASYASPEIVELFYLLFNFFIGLQQVVSLHIS
jgi:hypothetical protein